MKLDQFVAEARALARPGLLLRNQGEGEPVAWWHGLAFDGPVISVRHAGQWLTLFAGETGASVSASAKQPIGSPLYAQPYSALPPVDAVFRYGSLEIERFLAQNSWTREDEFNDNFPDSVPQEYERIWQDNCPMYADGVMAACGGWPFPWPDGSFLQNAQSELVVWTLAEAEPCFEVFFAAGQYRVYERVT